MVTHRLLLPRWFVHPPPINENSLVRSILMPASSGQLDAAASPYGGDISANRHPATVFLLLLLLLAIPIKRQRCRHRLLDIFLLFVRAADNPRSR